MSPQDYIDSIGLGHLQVSAPVGVTRSPNLDAAGFVSLGDGIVLQVEAPTDETYGGVWLTCNRREPAGDTPEAALAQLENLAREAEVEAARYRAALAVLRGDAPQIATGAAP